MAQDRETLLRLELRKRQERERQMRAELVRRGELQVEEPQPVATEVVPEQKRRLVERLDSVLMQVPGVPALSEIAAGANRSIVDTLDFFGPDAINEILRLGGSERRMPTARQAADQAGIAPERGAFMGRGSTTDMLAAGGEVIPAAIGVAQGMRYTASKMPQMGQYAQNKIVETIQRIVQQMGGGSRSVPAVIGQDVGLGFVSGSGAELGEQVGGAPGAVIGAILAPLGAQGIFAGTRAGLRTVLSSKETTSELMKTLGNFSDEAAAALLAEQMVREGLGPEDVIKILDDLGPDALPADTGPSFARLLRSASNMVPRIQGRINTVLGGRQGGQSSRLASALDDVAGVPGLSVDDEIARIRAVYRPLVDDAYAAARARPLPMPERIQSLFENAPIAKKALNAANRVLDNRRAVGDQISHIDVIDAVKQQLDDQINLYMRQGRNNLARDVIRVKNVLTRHADEFVPEYAQARNLYSGRAALESAADLGQGFTRMRVREVREAVQSMGDAELRMFRLGAKQAILDKLEGLRTNANAWNSLFGRNGDMEKLRAVFPDQQSFNAFRQSMQREGIFSFTRSESIDNSTTIRQGIDAVTSSDIVEAANAALNPGSAPGFFLRVLNNFRNNASREAQEKVLNAAADILLDDGMDPKVFADILRAGDAPRISAVLQKAFSVSQTTTAPAMRAAISTAGTRDLRAGGF